MPSKPTQDHRYKNPDNDPRGPYRLTSLTSSLDQPSHQYEWHGKTPPKGQSWNISKEKADELERDGRIVFRPSGMPLLKRYLAEGPQELQDFLRDIPNQQFDREVDFIQRVLPRLMDIFGYAENETFYDLAKGPLRADAVLSDSIEARPWVVVEVKSGKMPNTAQWTKQLGRYLQEFNCRRGLLISPDLLVLLVDYRSEQFDLKNLNAEESEKIFKAIERSAQRQTSPAAVPQHSPFVDLIEAVEKAQTNADKGKSLEDLARFLFESVAPLKCKYSNLQTRSSEIDIVLEYDRSIGHVPLFDELGQFSLIECKNWSKPVGVGPVRDFMGKLDKCRARLGVIFSKNGVTGVDAGADALREIQSCFDRNGVFVLVFSLEDIRGIESGHAFLASLDRKADSLRFDVQSW